MFPFIILFLVFVFVIFLASLFWADTIFVYLTSMILVLVGIYTMVNGILDLNNWFTQSMSVVFLGVGVYVLVMSSMEAMEDEDF